MLHQRGPALRLLTDTVRQTGIHAKRAIRWQVRILRRPTTVITASTQTDAPYVAQTTYIVYGSNQSFLKMRPTFPTAYAIEMNMGAHALPFCLVYNLTMHHLINEQRLQIIEFCYQNACSVKSPWSSRQRVGLLDVKPEFEPQAGHQKKFKKYFFGDLWQKLCE